MSDLALCKRLGHGAAHAWRHTTPAGRKVLHALALGPAGCTAMSCGRSGYQVAYADGRTVRLRGAGNVLGQVAWTGRALPTSRAGDAPREPGPTILSNGRTYFGMSSGLERGKDVHAELQDFVTLPPRTFQARYACVDPMTHALLTALDAHGLVGVAAELIVHDASIGCGTAIDALCLDKAGRLVAVELKTGYGLASFIAPLSAGKHMKRPFERLADTPLARAQLQLLYGMELLRRSHKVAARGIVVHVTRKGAVRVHAVPAEMARHYTPLIFEGAGRKQRAKKHRIGGNGNPSKRAKSMRAKV